MSLSSGSSSLLVGGTHVDANGPITTTTTTPSPFKDPDFNARQWINAALPASLITTSTTTNSSDIVVGGGSAVEKKAAELITHLQLRSQEVTSNLDDAITQTLVRMPRAVAEVSRMSTEAKRLRSKVTEIRADVSSTSAPTPQQQPATTSSAETPNAVEESTSTTTASTHDAQEVQRLQSTKEKLVWCRSVLKTAQTLSTELRELEGALEALGKQGGGGGGSDQGMGDIEHIANLTRNLNGNLHQLQAVDSSFGQHYAQRIAASEKNLQRMVEQEILETVRHRSSLRDIDVSDTDKVLLEIGCLQQQQQHSSSGGGSGAKHHHSKAGHHTSSSSSVLLGVGPTSLLSLDNSSILQHARKAAEGVISSLQLCSSSSTTTNTTKGSSSGSSAGADVGRTAKLLSILRAIDRDEVVIDAFISSGVDSLVSKFQSVVLEPLTSNTSSTSSTAQPQLSALLMRFYFHLGVTVANEVNYLSRLYLASLLSGRATGLQDASNNNNNNKGDINSSSSTSGPTSSLPQVIGGGSVGGGGGGGMKTSITELEAVVMDAVSLMARTVIDKISQPLKDALKKMTNATSSSLSSTNTNTTCAAAAVANEELVRCYEAASLLVDFGADTLVTSPDMKITIDEIYKTSSSTSTNNNNKSGVVVVSESSSSLRVSAMVPKAMGSTAGRGYAINVESFITKERSLLESYSKALLQQQPSSSSNNNSTSSSSLSSNDVSMSVLNNGKGLISCIEGVLSRCARFFPQETVHPVLNTWSRQVANILVFARKPASDITQSVKAAMAKGGEEGLGQQPRLKDSIARRGSVEGLLGLYGTIRSLYVLLIAVETRGLKQFISTRSSSSSSAVVDAVVEPDVLQEIFKQAEKECINSIAVLESSIVSVLLSPLHCAVTSFVKMPSLLVGKGGASSSSSGAKAHPITAQSTNYSTGDAVYSPVSQSMCDFLLEVPDIVEALAVILERAAATTATTTTDDTTTTTTTSSPSSAVGGAALSSIVPVMTTTTLLTSILNETQSTMVHRLCTELVAVHSRQSLEQLAVDLDYITPVLEAVRDEGGAGGVVVATGDEDEDAVGGEDSTPASLFDALVKRVRDANDGLAEATSTSAANLFPFYLIGHAPEQQRSTTATANTTTTASLQNQKRQ